MMGPEHADDTNPTHQQIRDWANDPNAEWPDQNWKTTVACRENANLILSLASEPCPQSDFFVDCLYRLINLSVTTNGKSISVIQIVELFQKGAKGSNWKVLNWIDRAYAFFSKNNLTPDDWKIDNWELDDESWRQPDEEREVIIKEIQDAFRGVPRGKVTLHEADVIDYYGSEKEAEKARSLDTESRWEEIPDEHIEQETTVLNFVDPQSWKYYIAAYMVWTLRYFRIKDSLSADTTTFTLNLSVNHPNLKRYGMERFHLLNQKQSVAVYRFLNYMVQDYDDAAEAIQKYWGQFDPANEN
ncbi:DUF6714 family protein [uncultured Gimesia sp.]|uniref:DUF6714 family protein n=1 Tax=uncultured Gimesia sp. TaxID=1678688 RepID=UPI00262B06F0|nr:DUF6714 family protein [uncultured Gimesia sp.]